MIEVGSNIEFIVGAYAATTVPVGFLVFHIIRDYKALKKRLAELERQGIHRRSEEPKS